MAEYQEVLLCGYCTVVLCHVSQMAYVAKGDCKCSCTSANDSQDCATVEADTFVELLRNYYKNTEQSYEV